jgi:hypothetical protein
MNAEHESKGQWPKASAGSGELNAGGRSLKAEAKCDGWG